MKIFVLGKRCIIKTQSQEVFKKYTVTESAIKKWFNKYKKEYE